MHFLQTIVKQKTVLLESVFLQWLSAEIISGVYTLQNQLQSPPTSPFYLQRIQPAPASHTHIRLAPTTPTSLIRVSFLYKTTSNQPWPTPITLNYSQLSLNQPQPTLISPKKCQPVSTASNVFYSFVFHSKGFFAPTWSSWLSGRNERQQIITKYSFCYFIRCSIFSLLVTVGLYETKTLVKTPTLWTLFCIWFIILSSQEVNLLFEVHLPIFLSFVHLLHFSFWKFRWYFLCR